MTKSDVNHVRCLEMMTIKQLCLTRLRQLSIQKQNNNVENEKDWHSENWVLSNVVNGTEEFEYEFLGELIKAIVKNKQSTEVE